MVLLIINMLLSFFIEPAGGASGRMWSGYYAEQELDTIFVGSSVCQQTFVPEIFNEKLGVKAYNMGTPSQAVPQTIRAIEVALEEHDIKTVVYAMGFSSLKYMPIPEAEVTFESARTQKKGGVNGLLATVDYIYSESVRSDVKSINFLFPWLYNYEDYSKETLVKNATEKLERIKTWIATGEYDATDGLNQGFRNDDTSIFNYDNKWELNTDRYYESYFDADMLAEFEKMLQLCEKNELDLIVLNTPHPAFDVVACYEYYARNQEQLKELCKKYGADYYDFSLAKEEIYEVREEYFCDFEHLNREGAFVFCKSLCDFLIRRANGEEVNEDFYSVDEFLEMHAGLIEEWEANR